MSPLTEVRLVAQRELSKSFRSAKGIVLLVLSVIGGAISTLAIVKGQQLKHENLANADAESLRQLRETAWTKVFGDPATGKSLADAPEALVFALILTVWLTPLVISLLGFDSVSGDLQHKAVRYWTLRTRRSSYFVGKWAGVFASVSALTLVMHLIIWVTSIVMGESTAANTIGWGIRLWLVTLPISAVWCGIATLVSSLLKSPIIALLVTFASFFGLFLIWFIGGVARIDALMYAYPNFYDALLVHPHVNKALTGLAACLGMLALYVGGGSYLFMKRDV